MHGDDVHETREINGLWIRDSDYRARPIWTYSGHLLNLRNSNPLLIPYTFEGLFMGLFMGLGARA